MKKGNRLLAFLLSAMLAVGSVQMPVIAGEAAGEYATVKVAEDATTDASEDSAASTEAVASDAMIDADSVDVPTDETAVIENEESEASEASDDLVTDPVSDIVPDTASGEDFEEGSDQTESSDNSYDTSPYEAPAVNDQLEVTDDNAVEVTDDNAGVDSTAGDGDVYDEDLNSTAGDGDVFDEDQNRAEAEEIDDSVDQNLSSENDSGEIEEQAPSITSEQIRAFQEKVKVWKYENQITIVYDSTEDVQLGYSIYSVMNDGLMYSGNLAWKEQSNFYYDAIDFDAVNETRKAEDENVEAISIKDIPVRIVIDDGVNQFEESISSDLGTITITEANNVDGQLDLKWESTFENAYGYSIIVRNATVQTYETAENSISINTPENEGADFVIAAYAYDDNTGMKYYCQADRYEYTPSISEEPVTDDVNQEVVKEEEQEVKEEQEEQEETVSAEAKNAETVENVQEVNKDDSSENGAPETGATDEVALEDFAEEELVSTEAMGAASFAQAEYNGHLYQLFNEGVSWSTAKSRCEKKGGHLVTITSSGEYSFCKSLLGDLSPKYCWMGATHASGSWKWITGESWSFTAWSPNQPNGSGGGTYALMQNFKGVGTAWNWDDQGNSGKSPSEKYQGAPYYHLTKNYCYICEWEPKITGLEEITNDFQKADRKICITWDRPETSNHNMFTSVSYQVQYSTEKSFSKNTSNETIVRLGDSPKVDGYSTKSLDRLTTYYFRVRGIYKYLEGEALGAWSDVISAKTCSSLLVKELWGFNNGSDKIDLSYFQYMLPYEVANANSKGGGNGENGICNGMCIIASLMMTYNVDLNVKSYGAENLSSLKYNSSIKDYIKYAQAWSTHRNFHDFSFCGTDEEVSEYQNGNMESHPPIIILTQINKDGNNRTAEHAVIGLALIRKSDEESLIKIYDPNYKGNEERYIHLIKDENMGEKGWKWEYKSDFFTTYSGYFGVSVDDMTSMVDALMSNKYEKGDYNDLIFCTTVTPGRFWHDYQNSIATALVQGFKAEKAYTGNEIEQSITVTAGNRTLIEDHDYMVEYENNKKPGEAKIIINGTDSYCGCIVRTFKISKKTAQSITVKTTSSSIDVGKTATVSISGAKGKKSYMSSDPSIATVDVGTGVVTGKKPGTVTITATSAATSKYYEASGTVTITVKSVLTKPGNCRFSKWNNEKYNSCQLAWNKVAGADGYQTVLSWTDGSHATWKKLKASELSQNCTVAVNHVSQLVVRAFINTEDGPVYGPWSNVEYITPSPATFKYKKAGTSKSPKAKISWNTIYGCNGYNVFVTTNPKGTWYWNQSTATKATATSATITKYRGKKLKKGTKYYVRIVTRRKRNGVFCTVPMPSSSTYIGSFKIK